MEEEVERRRRRLMRRYKIQEVIKRRQIMLVQVVKDERGNKGASLTTYLSLAGRYCVLMPNTARGGGVSRKITSATDRKRLKDVINSLDVPEGMGLIVRTAGAKRTKAEIKRDYEYLMRLWENIRETTMKSIAPALIYEEEDLVKRAIRDMFDKDIDEVQVEGEEAYKDARDFMRMLMPSQAKKVQAYREPTPLFVKHRIEDSLSQIYSPVVPLRSGGYLVINQAEALVAIDVNSGKATRERNIEATALKTNMEAAEEAARQLRLRDLAGLIVIDFIDMDESKNNRAVEKKLKDALKDDRARIQMGKISSFGLMELSRQRRRTGVLEGTTHSCPHCQGSGRILSVESSALAALRAVEVEAAKHGPGAVTLKLPPDVALYVLNEKRGYLARLQMASGLYVAVQIDESVGHAEHEIERTSHSPRVDDIPLPTPVALAPEPEEPDVFEDEEDEEAEEEEVAVSARSDEDSDDEGRGRGRGRGRRRRRGGRRDETDEAPGAERPASEAADGDEEDDRSGRRRRPAPGRRRRLRPRPPPPPRPARQPPQRPRGAAHRRSLRLDQGAHAGRGRPLRLVRHRPAGRARLAGQRPGPARPPRRRRLPPRRATTISGSSCLPRKPSRRRAAGADAARPPPRLSRTRRPLPSRSRPSPSPRPLPPWRRLRSSPSPRRLRPSRSGRAAPRRRSPRKPWPKPRPPKRRQRPPPRRCSRSWPPRPSRRRNPRRPRRASPIRTKSSHLPPSRSAGGGAAADERIGLAVGAPQAPPRAGRPGARVG